MKGYGWEESAVDDFAQNFLGVGYETEQTVIRTRRNIRLTHVRAQVCAKTDVCVMDINLSSSGGQKSINPADPEPQLVAEAIAAFQANKFE